jgi:hypothetical protein
LGNTDPDSAYVSVHTPILNAGSWVGYGTGSAKIGTPSTSIQNTSLFSTLSINGLIPSSGCITDNGVIWVADYAVQLQSTYNDTLYLRKGIFNTGTEQHEYTTLTFPFSVNTADSTKLFSSPPAVAFSGDGQVGYLIPAVCSRLQYLF